MIAEERRRKLLETLHKNGALSVANASDLLQVSRMTVHRDLDQLAAAGLLRKVHGGAVPVVSGNAPLDLARPFDERMSASPSAKELISKHLATVLNSGAKSIVLDASSTVFLVAHELKQQPGNENILIMTNGVPLFQELQRRNLGFRLALTGGEIHPRTGSLVGPLAVKTLEGMHFDLAVVSAAGMMEDECQVYDSTAEGSAMKQAFMGKAEKSVLAIDKTKINFLAPFSLCKLSDFDLLVTEDGIVETRNKRPTKRKEGSVLKT